MPYHRRFTHGLDRELDQTYLRCYLARYLQSGRVTHGHDLSVPLMLLLSDFLAWLDQSTPPLKHKPNPETLSKALAVLGISQDAGVVRTYGGAPRPRARWALGLDLSGGGGG